MDSKIDFQKSQIRRRRFAKGWPVYYELMILPAGCRTAISLGEHAAERPRHDGSAGGAWGAAGRRGADCGAGGAWAWKQVVLQVQADRGGRYSGRSAKRFVRL